MQITASCHVTMKPCVRGKQIKKNSTELGPNHSCKNRSVLACLYRPTSIITSPSFLWGQCWVLQSPGDILTL